MLLRYSLLINLVNYANMAWPGSHKTKLHNIHLKQKHAIRLIWNENKFTHTKPLIQSKLVLNVFQINIQNILVFMPHVKTCSNNVTSIFANTFTYPSHRYPINFWKNNFPLAKYLTHKSKYKISIRCPSLWNNVLSST